MIHLGCQIPLQMPFVVLLYISQNNHVNNLFLQLNFLSKLKDFP